MPAAEPGDHAAQEPVLLRHGVQLVDDVARHQPEITDVDGYVHFGNAAEQTIETMGGRAFEGAFSSTCATAAEDYVEALVHARHHLAEQFRRILQIGVDYQHALAARDGKPRRDRELMPVIAREIDRDHAGSRRRQRAHAGPCVVRGAVVHENDFERAVRETLAGVQHPLDEEWKRRFLVIAGRDDRQARPKVVGGLAHEFQFQRKRRSALSCMAAV